MVVRSIIKKVYQNMGRHTKIPFRVVFADGSSYQNIKGKTEFEIIYKTRRAEWKTLLFTEVGLVSCYINQSIDIKGDIMKLVQSADDSGHNKFPNPLNALGNLLHEVFHAGRTVNKAKKNARHHYNRGTEMFSRYVDPTMTYTCAYWKEGTKTLEQAQWNKLDHVCKKLRLKKNDTLIDIGSGWGSLLFHAYEHYGALGTNYSPTPDQNKEMRRRIKKKGCEGKIKIVEKDYREVTGKFDKYASLGVYEHAGKGQLKDWIKSMAECLKDDSVGVLHFIGNIQSGLHGTGWMIRKYIFPGGYLPGLAETIELMDKHGLEILDIENLRRHYTLTLHEWAKNFDRNWEEIHALNPKKFDERFRRLWRFYLYSCAQTFSRKNNHIGLFQIVFSKGKVVNNYPMTREFLYK